MASLTPGGTRQLADAAGDKSPSQPGLVKILHLTVVSFLAGVYIASLVRAERSELLANLEQAALASERIEICGPRTTLAIRIRPSHRTASDLADVATTTAMIASGRPRTVQESVTRALALTQPEDLLSVKRCGIYSDQTPAEEHLRSLAFKDDPTYDVVLDRLELLDFEAKEVPAGRQASGLLRFAGQATRKIHRHSTDLEGVELDRFPPVDIEGWASVTQGRATTVMMSGWATQSRDAWKQEQKARASALGIPQDADLLSALAFRYSKWRAKLPVVGAEVNPSSLFWTTLGLLFYLALTACVGLGRLLVDVNRSTVGSRDVKQASKPIGFMQRTLEGMFKTVRFGIGAVAVASPLLFLWFAKDLGSTSNLCAALLSILPAAMALWAILCLGRLSRAPNRMQLVGLDDPMASDIGD